MSATATQTPATPASPPVAGGWGAPRRGRGRVRDGLPLGGFSGTSLGVVVLWVSLLVLLPLAAVVGKAFGSGWGDFWSAITNRENRDALLLTVSLAVAVALVNAVMGTVIAWVLVRERFRGSAVLEFVIDIPFALPTVVAGLVMLALYGQDSPIDVNLYGSRIGMFVALLFVTLPFAVRTVQPVLIDLDRDKEQAAASLGASPPVVFRRIVLPQIMPAMSSGAALAFARALGEYGSLVFISSAIPYHTEFASVIIYGKLQEQGDGPTQQAAALATVLLLASGLVLVLLDLLQRRMARHG